MNLYVKLAVVMLPLYICCKVKSDRIRFHMHYTKILIPFFHVNRFPILCTWEGIYQSPLPQIPWYNINKKEEKETPTVFHQSLPPQAGLHHYRVLHCLRRHHNIPNPNSRKLSLLGSRTATTRITHVRPKKHLPIEPSRLRERHKRLLALDGCLLVDTHHVTPPARSQHGELVASGPNSYCRPFIFFVRLSLGGGGGVENDIRPKNSRGYWISTSGCDLLVQGIHTCQGDCQQGTFIREENFPFGPLFI